MFHCHTTESDGGRSVPDAVAWYAEHRYDVLAITDHNRLTRARPPAGSDLLLVPGVEVDAGRARFGEPYHIVGIGLGDMIELPRDTASRHALPAQEVVDRLRRAGAAVFAAHPYWSNLVVDDLLALEGIIGLEVYNTNTDVDVAKGDSGVHWDGCLSTGRPLFGIANDDTHWRLEDNGRAWTMLRMDAPDPAAVVRALGDGAFYASTGAVLDDVTFNGGTAEVRIGAPGAREVRFMCDGRWGHRAVADGALLSHVKFRLRGRERFLRVEVVGPNGARAWTNPLLVRS